MFGRPFFVYLIFWVALAAVILSRCTPAPPPVAVRADWYPEVDSTFRPQDDFYRFINHRWLGQPQLAPGQVAASPVLKRQEEVQRILLARLLAIETDGSFPEGTDQRKALNFFTWASDSAAAEQGIRAVQPWLRQIQAIKTEVDFLRMLRQLQSARIPVFFDVEQTTETTIMVLPLSREDRLALESWNPGAKRVRAQVIQTALEQLGVTETESSRRAQEIDGLEKALDAAYAKGGAEPVRRRLAEFVRTTQVAWEAFFSLAGNDTLVIHRPAYWQVVNQFIAATSNLDRKKDFLIWRVLAASAPFLGPSWLRVVYGDRKIDWQRHSLLVTQRVFPDVFGRMFVRGNLDLNEQNRVAELGEHVRLALAQKVKETSRWPDSLKRYWLKTLAVQETSVLPARPYESYQTLEAGRKGVNSWAARMLGLLSQRTIHAPGDSVMRSQPFSTAVQLIAHDRIFVPLALLEPPFLTSDAAWNYGGLGVALSRQLLHQMNATSAGANLEVNMVDVAYRAWQRYKMESGQVAADDFSFFAAVAYHHREINLGDPAVGAERAAEVFDALSSFPPFYQKFGITTRDKMFRETKYRAVIW